MKRVLVVDDDAQVLGLTARWLLAAGHLVAVAGNFKDASTRIRLSEPEVVIADIRLGEFNGLQLGILARQLRSDVRLVLMSGWDDPVIRHEAEQLGAAFVQKPLRAKDLLAAIVGEPAPVEPSELSHVAPHKPIAQACEPLR